MFFGTEIGERKVGNYMEQDGRADGQTSKSKSSLDVRKNPPAPQLARNKRAGSNLTL